MGKHIFMHLCIYIHTILEYTIFIFPNRLIHGHNIEISINNCSEVKLLYIYVLDI